MRLRNYVLLFVLAASVHLFGQEARFTRSGKAFGDAMSVSRIPSRAAEDTDEIVLGYCPDEFSDDAQGVGVPNSSVSMGAAIYIPAARMATMQGGKITKLRIGTGAGLTGVYAWIRTSLTRAAAAVQRVGTTVDGWMEVTFDTPYEITGEGVYIGYSGTQPSGVFGVIMGGEDVKNAAWLGINNSWSDYYGEGFGVLYIQAIAEASLPEVDLGLSDLSIDKEFYTQEDLIALSVDVTNYGKETVPGFTLGYSLDNGQKVTETLAEALAPGASFEYQTEVSLAGCAEGAHELNLTIEGLDGGLTDGIAANNTIGTKAYVYSEAYPRKVLLEHFTTINCVNCPYGSKVLTTLTNGRDDIVWVAHHVGYGTDELTLDGSSSLLDFGVSGAPSAMLDRTYIPQSDANYPPFGIGYSNATYGAGVVEGYLDYCLSIPAFVSVDVTNEYDPETRELVVNVTGERQVLFSEFYSDVCLSVYLTEDGILAKVAQAGANAKYVHNHVLRASLTDILGDPITWNGDTYTYSARLVLDEAWVAAKMKVVAFVNKPFDTGTTSPNDAQVLNAGESQIEDPTYVSIDVNEVSRLNARIEDGKIVVDGDYKSLEVYTPAGLPVRNEALQRGVYLVRIVTGDRTVVTKVY